MVEKPLQNNTTTCYKFQLHTSHTPQKKEKGNLYTHYILFFYIFVKIIPFTICKKTTPYMYTPHNKNRTDIYLLILF